MALPKRKFEVPLKKFDSDMWSFYIPVRNDIAEEFIEEKDRRVLCSINGAKPFHCALLPNGEGGWFILVNAKRRKEQNLMEGEPLKIELEKDTSEYGMPMPAELAEALAQDDWANELFHALTPGKIRNIIHYVAQVKSSDIKIRRALVILEHLKANQGQIIYKKLSEEMKEANRRENKRW